MDSEPILLVNAPTRARELVERWRGERPVFTCVLAHTDTCLMPGVSSAGLTEELRPLTPAADAEVVLMGEPVCMPLLPSNPAGPPGPAGITRAALEFATIEARFVGAGLRVWPQASCVRASEQPGADISLGRAVADAAALFDLGLVLGRGMATEAPYMVLAESVPGGTTSALTVLLALGYAAEGRVSGSMPGNAHALKSRIARLALENAQLRPGDGRHDPLGAVSRVGDPMQPLATGLALGALRAGGDVLLAGGSQMVAVAALMRALAGTVGWERLAIGTTRWVVEDPSSDVSGLARDVSADLPLLAANLDFSHSGHTGLREYERFMVKEGVGAGGACIAALLATGQPMSDLLARIESVYDGLLGRLTTSDTADSRRR